MIKKYLFHIWRIIIALPLFITYLLSGFIPKSSNLWLFGAWEGQYFRGNSKHFFLYIKKFHSDIKCIWITKNFSLYKKLKKEGIKIYFAYSFRGMIINALAKYIFVSHDICDVNQYFTRKAVVIDLSHVTCPIKKMGYSSKFDNYYRPNSLIKKNTKNIKEIYL